MAESEIRRRRRRRVREADAVYRDTFDTAPHRRQPGGRSSLADSPSDRPDRLSLRPCAVHVHDIRRATCASPARVRVIIRTWVIGRPEIHTTRRDRHLRVAVMLGRKVKFCRPHLVVHTDSLARSPGHGRGRREGDGTILACGGDLAPSALPPDPRSRWGDRPILLTTPTVQFAARGARRVVFQNKRRCRSIERSGIRPALVMRRFSIASPAS